VRVLAALSGGVDSAVAAARAVDAGHEVVGVHMALTRNRAQTRSGSRGCCSIEDSADARWAAQILGIPFYVWDLSEEFEERVVADFLDEYRAGRTPNPCVRCNERVKFDALLERALALGGWAPSCYDCALCGVPGPHRAFHVQAGGAVCESCRSAGAVEVEPSTMALLGALLSGDWAVADASGQRERSQASGLVSAYTTWYLERRLRSLALVERA